MVKAFVVEGSSIVGPISNFSSTGIKDLSSVQTVTVTDGKLTVDNIAVKNLDGNVTVRGDFKIYGVLDAGFVRTTELVTNQRYEKQFLEFSSPDGDSIGTGFLWLGGRPSRQFVLKADPLRFWLTEHVDIPEEKSFMIGTAPVLSFDTLGTGVVNSSLKKVGTLQSLTVDGEFTLDNHIFYSPDSQKLGIGTDRPNGVVSILDHNTSVEFIITGDLSNGYGKLGTFNTKGVSIVTDDTPRISITETGHITLGQEYRDSTIIRAYGKMGIGVKNPSEQLEVAGNIKFGNRMFANGNQAPTDGSYQVGDIVWNSKPRSGNFVGWVCISTGSPGSWRGFGLIE
jgi:hypothetical protein